MKKIWLLLLLGALAWGVQAANKSDPSLAAEFEQISKEHERAQQDFSQAYSKASEEERKKLTYPAPGPYASRMIALAEKNPKDPAALKALLWAIERTYHDSSRAPKALALLQEHHIASPDLERACTMVSYGQLKESKPFLTEVLEKNPHKEVKGAASLSLGRMALRDDREAAEKYFNDVVDKYGTKDQKERAKGQLFEMHNLAIGKVAPDIEGKDIDGKKFKLSDYRGKVVVIDFWGDW
jgi:hypothetical protein